MQKKALCALMGQKPDNLPTVSGVDQTHEDRYPQGVQVDTIPDAPLWIRPAYEYRIAQAWQLAHNNPLHNRLCRTWRPHGRNKMSLVVNSVLKRLLNGHIAGPRCLRRQD